MNFTGLEKSGIYSITNVINGKRYIGSTTNFIIRCRGHRTKLNRNVHYNIHLQSAFNKYGSDNFKFECIEQILKETFKTEELFIKTLLDRENYWIQYYNANLPEYGYNFRLECTTNTGIKHSEEFRRRVSEAKKGKPIPKETKEALKIYLESVKGVSNKAAKNYFKTLSGEKREQVMTKLLNNLEIARKNKQQRKLETGCTLTEEGRKSYRQKKGFVVYMYKLTGEFIKKFDTLSDAMLFLDKVPKNTSSMKDILDKKIYCGYFWLSKYTDKIPYSERLVLLNNSNNSIATKKVIQYDLQYNVIKIWDRIHDAAKHLGYKKSTPIKNSIDKNISIKNYYFKYIEAYNSDIIGKPEELLETPDKDNQQPSQELTSLEGSETNS